MTNEGDRGPKILLGIILASLCAGCAYMGERGRDLRDIVTFSIEDREIGAVVRPILPLGICVGDGDGWGLRDGYFGHYQYTERTAGIPFGGVLRDVSFTPESDCRKKWYNYCNTKDGQATGNAIPPIFAIEANFALYYGFRVGVSLSELMDFMLGLLTIDTMADDKGFLQSENTKRK